MAPKTRLAGTASVLTLITTTVWLVLLIVGMASTPSPTTLDETFDYVSGRGVLFGVTYANAILITLFASSLMALLYRRVRDDSPEWSMIGLVFVPVYTVLALIAYTSQVTIVPRLAHLLVRSDLQSAGLVLAEMTQAWPDSMIAVLNNLAYAVLGIPQIIFGVILARQGGLMRTAGILFALSGAASIAGFAGIAWMSAALGAGSVAGGALFLAALIPMSVALLRGDLTP